MRPDIGPGPETTWAALRFADRDTEQGYQSWFVDRAILFSRVGIIAAIVAWLTAAAATLVMPSSDQMLVLRVALFGVLPALGLGLVATFRVAFRSHIQTIVALANTLSGLASTYICFAFVAPRPDLAMGLVITTAFFAFTIFRLDPLRAIAAVTPYVVLFVVGLFGAMAPMQLSVVQLVAYLVIAVNALGAGVVACVAMNSTSRENYRQEKVIEAQRASIEQEQARSETLLGSILPRAISDRLKVQAGLIADQYAYATVVFVDIVGFTQLTTQLKPAELVDLLNDLFSRFDQIAALHGVERIKTIGDAYMAAVGVPIERADHAVAGARFALAARDAVADYAAKRGRVLAVRIGIGSGAVIAGVVGTVRFAYDLWGDTVNFASRMESEGVADAIQVCPRTYALLSDRFRFDSRGEIDVRGRGKMSVYLLRGALEI